MFCLPKTAWPPTCDTSKGVHNPSFVHGLLFATTQKVNALQ